MQRILLLFISTALIYGCASTNGQGSNKTIRQNKKIAACITTARQSEWLVVDVPAANSFIANKMVASTMSMGGSNTVDALVKALSQSMRLAIAVVGENDEVTAATLEAAMRNLAPGANRSTQPVCFVGDEEYGARLKSAAANAGIDLLILPNP